MKKLTEEQEREMVSRYLNGEKSSDLIKEYGYKTRKSLEDKVKKYGYKMRTREESEMMQKKHRNFSIKSVDSPFKAYWLGLMITDGWIDKKGTIYLSMADKDVIEFVSKVFDKEYTIIQREGCLNQYRVAFNHPELVKQLNERGIYNKKSKTKEHVLFYEEEQKYIPYFIRGVIDGDGWVRKDGKEFFICTGSEKFAYFVKDMLENKLYMTELNIVKGIGSWTIRSAETKNINILKAIVYDRPYGMSRKYNVLHGGISETTMESAA